MPRLPKTVRTGTSLVLALAAAVAAAGTGWAQATLEDLSLRPAIGQAAKGSAAKGKGAARPATARTPEHASPPGSGAGQTGFVSTNPWSKGTAPRAASRAPESPRQNLAQRVQQTIEQDRTAGVEPQRPVVRRRPVEEEPYAPVGFRAGSFEVRPSAEISYGYDDNPFRVNTGKQGSRFTKVEGKIEARSNWSRHELAGELRGAFTDYLQVSGNDRPEAEAKLRGRIDITSDTRLDLEGRAALTTDAAGSPEAITSARRPPHVYTTEGSARLVHRFNRLELGLRGSVERRTHQDAELLSGVTEDLSDRDYTSYGLSLRAGYESTPGVKPFVEAGVDRRVFDHKIDFTGVQRGSDGMRLRGGIEFARERVLSGEVSAGYAIRRYDDPALDSISGLIFDASLIWRATGLTTVTLKANSEIGETTLPGASGVFQRQAAITIDHAFRRWLIGSIGGSFGLDDYAGAGRRDERFGVSAGLTYYLNRYLALKGEVRHERLRSTDPGADYTANIVMLGLRMQR